MMNYKKYSEIELFSYFIGLTDKFYTNDDLTFYFIIERIYSSNHLDEDATPNEVSNEEYGGCSYLNSLNFTFSYFGNIIYLLENLNKRLLKFSNIFLKKLSTQISLKW